MIRPSHIDEFAGGGGASEGHRIAMEIKKRLVRSAAVNHDHEAVCMYRMNHGASQTFCQDVFKVSPKDMLHALGYTDEEIKTAVGFLIESGWFSPDCKHFSKAKGAALLDKRVRGLAWILLKWAGYGGGGKFKRGPACPGVMFLENVEEFQTFGPLIADRCEVTGRVIRRDGTVAGAGERVPYWDQKLVPDPKRKGLYFRRFVRWLESFGARVEWRELRACDYGAPTIRKRLFMIIRFDGGAIEWPEPTHGDPASEEVKSGKLLPWVPAAAILDFSLTCPTIFMTRRQARAYTKRTGIKIVRPLAWNTLQRLADGVERYVINAADPYFVTYGQHGGRSNSIWQPVHTITASKKDSNGLAAVSLARVAHGERDKKGKKRGRGVHSVTDCLGSLTGSNEFALSSVFLAQHNTGVVGHDVREPLSALTLRGTQQTVVAVGFAKYYSTEQDPQMREPLHSLTTRDRFALFAAELELPVLTPELAVKARRVANFLRRHGVKVEGEFAMCGEFVIVDIGMRMLTPREMYRAQGFPENYIIDRGVDEKGRVILLSRTAQVKMCGNSVSPVVAAAIIGANIGGPVEQKEAA